jgi:uncharacterized membrane protein
VGTISIGLGILLILLAVCASFSCVYHCDIQVTQVFNEKGVGDDLDALVDWLVSIEHLLKRLGIYTNVPPTPAMTQKVVKIIVEILSTLALATKRIGQGRKKAKL